MSFHSCDAGCNCLQCFDAVGWAAGRAPVKNFEWCSTGMVICLERDADLHMAQLMPLPLTVSCFSKIKIGFTFLVPAHPGSPGKRAVKRVCVCVRLVTITTVIIIQLNVVNGIYNARKLQLYCIYYHVTIFFSQLYKKPNCRRRTHNMLCNLSNDQRIKYQKPNNLVSNQH